MTVARDDQAVLQTEVQTVINKVINTTVGRVIFNSALPSVMPFVNGLLKKKGLQQVVQYCHLHYGLEKTVEMLDGLKKPRLHLRDAVGAVDRHRRPGHSPGERHRSSTRRRDEVIKVEGQYLEGRDHQRRALQQGHRRVVGRHREDRRCDVLGDGGA
jgi:DNA-directed RNA polymerase subunit beta'